MAKHPILKRRDGAARVASTSGGRVRPGTLRHLILVCAALALMGVGTVMAQESDAADPTACLSAGIEPATASALGPASEGALGFYGDRVRALASAWHDLGATLHSTFANPRGACPPIEPARLVASSLLVLLTGAAFLIAAGLLLRRARRLLDCRSSGRRFALLAALALWLLFDACMVAAFFGGALASYLAINPPHPLAPEVLSDVCAAALVVLVIERGLNLLTNPMSPIRGLADLPARAARHTYLLMASTSLLLLLAGVAGRVLTTLGVPHDAVLAAVIPLSMPPFVLLAGAVWIAGRTIAVAMCRWQGLDDATGTVNVILAVPATIYLAGVWLLAVNALFHFEPNVGLRALASLLLPATGLLIAFRLRRAIADFYRPAPMLPGRQDTAPVQAPPATLAQSARSTARLMNAVWLVVGLAVVYLTAALWHIDLRHLVGIGSGALHFVFDVAVIVLIGFVVWSLATNAVARVLADPDRSDNPGRMQRLATLLPLLLRFIQIVILTLVAMVALSSLGVEIGPLLAGAGVVGIAVGLGAQQTIADIIAGILFLADDAFRIGEYVEVGDLRGTVEGISLRCLKLRHHRGALHTLPFGQMSSLTNFSRDWALVRLEFRVAADTNPALVKKLVKKIGEEMLADAELGPDLIETLKSQGVRSVEDGAAVIGVKFVAKPGHQFVVRREAYHRILVAFQENGIELVGRGVVVRVEGGDGATDAVVGAAASDIQRAAEAP